MTRTIGARWIFPVSRPPLRDGAVEVVDSRIQRLIPGGRAAASEDAGDVVIMPAPVNAHLHLEFSHLESPLAPAGTPMTDWIPLAVASRRELEGRGAAAQQDVIQSGLDQCAAHGTGAIGEIATWPWFARSLNTRKLTVIAFVERLCIDPLQAPRRLAELDHWLGSVPQSNPAARPVVRLAVSPHAPYSMLDEFFEQVVRWSIARGYPLAMHLAESAEEMQWLESGKGPFGELLEQLGSPHHHPGGRSARYYLQPLAAADRALVIHGNYLEPADLDFMAQHPDRLHLVWCPRTHEYFGHRPWPLAAATERNINVALGTDSRASNPDLNLWGEMQAVARQHPSLSPNRILEMGTINGARALGVDDELGSLEPGKRALFLQKPVDAAATDALACVLHSAAIETRQ